MSERTPATVVVAGEQCQIELPHLNQASFLNQKDWAYFTQKFQLPDGTFRCEITRQEWLEQGLDFVDTDLPLAEVVDHVVPRSRGGKDAGDNSQPATELQNLHKLAKDDVTWSRPSFFDQALNHTALRFSQNLAGYDDIRRYDDIWQNRMVSLSQRDVILLLAWVVRSGKLIGGVTAAFAINHSIIEEHGKASPRIRRIAILTHDTANRAQYAAELGGSQDKPSKWEQWGITEQAPKVLELDDNAGAVLQDKRRIAQHDIVVMCGQLLWKKNGQPFAGDRFGEYLSQFDLILIDEPHLAAGQADQIARYATCPVIGTTGTPHDRDRRFDPNRYVLLSTWTKQQADEYDGSLKYLPDEKDPQTKALDATRKPFLTVLDPAAGEVLRKGTEAEMDFSAEELESHGEQFAPVLAVARKVAQACHELEQYKEQALAVHRHGSGMQPTLRYYPHGLVAVDGIPTTEAVVQQLNTYFDRNRARYPKEEGWTAIAHHGGNANYKAKPLDEGSDWLRSDRELDHAINESCARILVVDNQSREGTSNPCCVVVGIGKKLGSVIEPGQRLPRAMGAVLDLKNNRCASAHLDRPQFITHSAWPDNQEVIAKALDYLINMESHLKALSKLDDFMIDVTPAVGDDNDPVSRGPLSPADKVELVNKFSELTNGDKSQIGHDQLEDERLQVEMTEWINEQYQGSQRKLKQAEELVEFVIDEPDTAVDVILDVEAAPPVYEDILLKEQRLEKITAEELLSWVKRRQPGIPVTLEYIKLNPDIWLAQYEDDHCVEVNEHRPGISINTLARRVGSDALASFRTQLNGRSSQKAFRFATSTVKVMLGCPRKQVLKDSGPYDIPQAHHLIHKNWPVLLTVVRNRMIKELPELKQLNSFVYGAEANNDDA